MASPGESLTSSSADTHSAASPSATSHKAAHTVLFTNELLCNIITCLPRLQDIVITTGVCHHWRDVLAADPTIQQALFLKPVEAYEALAENWRILDPDNQILVEDAHPIAQVHPLVTKICGRINGDFRRRSARTDSSGQVHYTNIIGPRSLSPVTDLVNSRGTWREMFMTQPPCKSMTIFTTKGSGQQGYGQVERDFRCKTGFRLRHLCAVLQWDEDSPAALQGGVVFINDFAIEGSPEVEPSPYFDPLKEFKVSKCMVRGSKVYRPAQQPSLQGCESANLDG